MYALINNSADAFVAEYGLEGLKQLFSVALPSIIVPNTSSVEIWTYFFFLSFSTSKIVKTPLMFDIRNGFASKMLLST